MRRSAGKYSTQESACKQMLYEARIACLSVAVLKYSNEQPVRPLVLPQLEQKQRGRQLIAEKADCNQERHVRLLFLRRRSLHILAYSYNPNQTC